MGTATYSGPADPPACRFGRGPERIAMRTLFVLLAIILLTQPAAARGKRDRGDEPKDDAQKKAKSVEAEKAYQDALKRIPDQNVKVDPWGNVR
jgi:hypothetical protein